MALVNVINVAVLDNPTTFTNPFQFDITFECVRELQDDLEWKVTYVGSAEDASRDQILEEVMVGPVNVGVNRFVLQATCPDIQAIPEDDLLGVTVILVTCSYLDQEFIRIGYYVNNAPAEGYDPENPPATVDISTVMRNILADQPRVTRIPINWNGQMEQDLATYNDMNSDSQAMGQGIIMDINEDSMDVERMQLLQ